MPINPPGFLHRRQILPRRLKNRLARRGKAPLNAVNLHPSHQLGMPREESIQLRQSRGPADRMRPELGLYWAVTPEHRGNGYATEAARAVIDHGFGELHLARIVATTDRDNLASIAVATVGTTKA